VLSLIGDKLTFAQHVPGTEQSPDKDVRESVHVEDAVFEQTALKAIDEAVKRLSPGARPVLLFAQDGRLYTAQEQILDEGGNSLHMLDYMRGLLMGQDVTHLILVSKLRQSARIQLARSLVGSGTLEGLGYYIELPPPPDPKSGKPADGVGFMGPFAYFKITLVDLATSTAVREERVVASNATVETQFKSGVDPWAALPSERKVQLLQGIIRAEVFRVVPRLLKQ
jgi:hypothetical protein